MIQEQMLCKEFAEKCHLVSTPETRLMDTFSELGELTKEVLKNSQYGSMPCTPSKEIADEMGDCLFSLLCLCNSLGIDAQEALQNALRKYETRYMTKGEISSGK